MKSLLSVLKILNEIYEIKNTQASNTGSETVEFAIVDEKFAVNTYGKLTLKLRQGKEKILWYVHLYS